MEKCPLRSLAALWNMFIIILWLTQSVLYKSSIQIHYQIHNWQTFLPSWQIDFLPSLNYKCFILIQSNWSRFCFAILILMLCLRRHHWDQDHKILCFFFKVEKFYILYLSLEPLSSYYLLNRTRTFIFFNVDL